MKYEVVRRKRVTRDMTLADVEDGQAFQFDEEPPIWYIRLNRDGASIHTWALDTSYVSSFYKSKRVSEIGEIEIKIIVEEE